MKYLDHCCEGALLIVDAAQEYKLKLFQTHLALKNDLEIIPVLNKIDLPVRTRGSKDQIIFGGCNEEC